jgi:hypothetical protein
LWSRSVALAGTPMGRNLQARLLFDALRLVEADGKLPENFPSEAAQPDVFWAQMRTAALLAAKDVVGARAQAALLKGQRDVVSARLMAAAAAQAKDWVAVASVPGLPKDERRYVVEVLADDAALETLVKQGGEVASSAALALASRKLGDGDWEAGARVLDPVDAKRAALWREAGRRANDSSPAGRVAFAKWLQTAALFEAYDTAFSRGLRARLNSVVAQPTVAAEGERARLEYCLLRSGARQRALEAYAAAFPSFPAYEARKPLVKEADALFNALLNWDASDSEAYEALLRASAPVKAILAAGRKTK